MYPGDAMRHLFAFAGSGRTTIPLLTARKPTRIDGAHLMHGTNEPASRAATLYVGQAGDAEPETNGIVISNTIALDDNAARRRDFTIAKADNDGGNPVLEPGETLWLIANDSLASAEYTLMLYTTEVSGQESPSILSGGTTEMLPAGGDGSGPGASAPPAFTNTFPATGGSAISSSSAVTTSSAATTTSGSISSSAASSSVSLSEASSSGA